jgi:hypothetical protein
MQIFVPRKKEKDKEKSHWAAFLFLDSISTMFNLQDRRSLGIRTFFYMKHNNTNCTTKFTIGIIDIW